MGSIEEAERGEEEEEEESPKELEPEEEEITMAGRGVGFSALLGFGRKKEFAVKKSRFGVRLEIESDLDKISLDYFPSLRTINMYLMLLMKKNVIMSHKQQLSAHRSSNLRVSSK